MQSRLLQSYGSTPSPAPKKPDWHGLSPEELSASLNDRNPVDEVATARAYDPNLPGFGANPNREYTTGDSLMAGLGTGIIPSLIAARVPYVGLPLSIAAGQLQDKVMSKLAPGAFETNQAAMQANPLASLIGGILSGPASGGAGVASLKGGAKAVGSAFVRNAAKGTLMDAGIQAGMNASNQPDLFTDPIPAIGRSVAAVDPLRALVSGGASGVLSGHDLFKFDSGPNSTPLISSVLPEVKQGVQSYLDYQKSINTPTTDTSGSGVLGVGLGGAQDVLGRLSKTTDPREYAKVYKEIFGKEVGPYFEKKKGSNIYQASMPDIEQFRADDGNIYATLLHGDTARADPYTTQDGRQIDMDGGGKFALSKDRAGHVFWSSEGKAADDKIRRSTALTKGLALVFASNPETVLNSRHGTNAYMGEIESGINLGKVTADEAHGVLSNALVKAAGIQKPLDLAASEKAFQDLSMTDRERVMSYLKTGERTSALGVPNQSQIVTKMTDPDYVNANQGDAVAYGYINPDAAGNAESFGVAGHNAYSRFNGGMGFGDPAKFVSITKLAKPAIDAWMKIQQDRYDKWINLPKSKRDEIIDSIAGLSDAKQVQYMKDNGYRDSKPTIANWFRSVNLSKAAVQLDQDLLRSTLYGEKSYATGIDSPLPTDGTPTAGPSSAVPLRGVLRGEGGATDRGGSGWNNSESQGVPGVAAVPRVNLGEGVRSESQGDGQALVPLAQTTDTGHHSKLQPRDDGGKFNGPPQQLSGFFPGMPPINPFTAALDAITPAKRVPSAPPSPPPGTEAPPEPPTPSLLDNAQTLRKAGLLTSPVTHMKNMLGNTSMQVAEEAAKAPAAIADIVRVALAKTEYARRSGLDKVLGTDRTVAGTDPRDVGAAFQMAATQGVKDAAEIIRTGKLANDALASPNSVADAMGIDQEYASKSPLANAYVNGVFRSLTAEDRLFRVYAWKRSIQEQAKVAAVNEAAALRKSGQSVPDGYVLQRAADLAAKPTDGMWAQAIADSELTTFNNDNPEATAWKNAKTSLRRSAEGGGLSGVAAKGALLTMDTFFPFVKTPTNVLHRVVEYMLGTAIAPIKAGVEIAKTPALMATRDQAQTALDAATQTEQQLKAVPPSLVGHDPQGRPIMTDPSKSPALLEATANRVASEKALKDAATKLANQAFTPEAQKQFAQTFGRGSIGLGLMALGYTLAQNGAASGFATNAVDRKRKEAKGQPAAAIQLGGAWHEIGSLAPVGNLIALGATLHELTQGPKALRANPLEAVGSAVGQVMGDSPILSGAESLKGLAETKNLRNFIGQTAASVVPAALADVAKSQDPLKRKADGLIAPLLAKLPYIRQNLPPNGPNVATGANVLNPLRSRKARTSSPIIQGLLQQGLIQGDKIY
jgi:hypothetical protein